MICQQLCNKCKGIYTITGRAKRAPSKFSLNHVYRYKNNPAPSNNEVFRCRLRALKMHAKTCPGGTETIYSPCVPKGWALRFGSSRNARTFCSLSKLRFLFISGVPMRQRMHVLKYLKHAHSPESARPNIIQDENISSDHRLESGPLGELGR